MEREVRERVLSQMFFEEGCWRAGRWFDGLVFVAKEGLDLGGECCIMHSACFVALRKEMKGE